MSDKSCELNRSMQHHLITQCHSTSPTENRSVRLSSVRTKQGSVPFDSMLANDFSY